MLGKLKNDITESACGSEEVGAKIALCRVFSALISTALGRNFVIKDRQLVYLFGFLCQRQSLEDG